MSLKSQIKYLFPDSNHVRSNPLPNNEVSLFLVTLSGSDQSGGRYNETLMIHPVRVDSKTLVTSRPSPLTSRTSASELVINTTCITLFQIIALRYLYPNGMVFIELPYVLLYVFCIGFWDTPKKRNIS